ncbi:ABC transporter substrate-binding protein [Terasakiispira papahanaumokuakeensis]|uniref:ABC transporter substrate-binding protein n=1 Tax=Terasakiispira papahanaumokuakeensis TaxID=197479 RepID=A0A1E2V5G9_9GAMM|nr:ABC transporter substrate-binding protein [Terasakiispira papahanaumokuakeensis]ODC02239.1 ABC transporter substrate-binding protein [Terasakiispira papahanaumokuakeensis]
MSIRQLLGTCCILLSLFSITPHSAQAEPLVINAALDQSVIQPLLDKFMATYPDIEIEYHDQNTQATDQSVIRQPVTADVIISAAMAQQMGRVNQGYARRLNSPQVQQWPKWAKWRNEVFGFTFEPIVMAYRLDLAQHMLPPTSHADLLKRLNDHHDILQQRVVTYTPQGSDLGYALYQQDARYSGRFWSLIQAMGRVQASTASATPDMLKGLSSGRYWLGYNLLGSYAMAWALEHPEVIVQVPQDYSLVVMRMAFIHKEAPHPQAAERFVNFLLSFEGQHILAGETPLFSIRPDVQGPYTAQRLKDQVGPRLYPINMNASLLALLDSQRHQYFMQRWQQSFWP